MKAHNIAIILMLSLTHLSFGQTTIQYSFDPSTGAIKNIDNAIFKRSKSYVYDLDFKESSEKVDSDFKVAFSVNNAGKGTLVLAIDDNDKLRFSIKSCIENTYNDSTDKYWKFNLIAPNGSNSELYLHIGDSGFGKFWLESGDNKRLYFTN